MAGSADPTEGLVNELNHLYSVLLDPQSTMSPEVCAERAATIAKAYVNEYPGDTPDPDAVPDHPGAEPDTPEAEFFSWSLWECLLKAIENWDTENQFKHNLDRTIAFVKALQDLPEQPKWWIWGREESVKSLPLLGPSMREAYNGPFTHSWPYSNSFYFPEFQNALAGAPPALSVPEKNVNVAVASRKRWLAIQGFIARLWIDIGCSYFDVYSIWATRQALEEWPAEPPSIFRAEGEGGELGWDETPACRALEVEAAAVWLRLAGPQIYGLTEIWGPNGNPDWPPNEGAPGRGGERWKGVDGMDKDKKRWALWREVLHDVIAWYDREQAGGRGDGWKVKEAATAALEAMRNVDQK